ncbi:hypothetical protein [Alkalinema sp. FACHB-956]|uniref:hypothetical protein n=1 Tax=Alkalinema sp. FACHB-956 TaxID=2692768 RepID=UPI001681DE79|nr:hypothetical protein [Alkalinema sp. FACHB-956]MBD2325902.1 hypothetical protein [Alkalinema sp. FACHB-956]
MFILELTLKETPVTLTVQKKEKADAEGDYQRVISAMKSSSIELLELTCDHQVGKKVAVFNSAICAVQVYEKTSGGTSGRTPGFFAVAES